MADGNDITGRAEGRAANGDQVHDLLAEDLVPFTRVSKRGPWTDAPPYFSSSTVHRRRLKGQLGVYLEAVRQGGRWYTSRQALERFYAELTRRATDRSNSVQPGPATPRRRRRQADQAAKQVETLLRTSSSGKEGA